MYSSYWGWISRRKLPFSDETKTCERFWIDVPSTGHQLIGRGFYFESKGCNSIIQVKLTLHQK